MRGCSAVKDQAKDANDADARLDQFIIRALNKIKKPPNCSIGSSDQETVRLTPRKWKAGFGTTAGKLFHCIGWQRALAGEFFPFPLRKQRRLRTSISRFPKIAQSNSHCRVVVVDQSEAARES